MNPLVLLDNWLNKITMYRLVLYGLGVLLACAALFGFTGTTSQSGEGILATTAVLFAACYAANKLLSKLYNAPTNSESFFITALILACILPPSTDPQRLAYIALAGVIAMASKFIVAWQHKHIFNPAAFAAVCMSLTGLVPALWWVGNPTLFPLTLLLGLLVLRKTRRFTLVGIFTIVAVSIAALVAVVSDHSVATSLRNAFLSGPLVFFATIMLTEPATMPANRYYQYLYALLVGVFYPAQLYFGVLSTSPHMVLLAGNLFAYAVTPIYQMSLKLKEKVQISAHVFDFVFTPSRQIQFIPGQYMEWTLPHHHVDGRGNRRTFTVASSPTEPEIHLGVKFYEPSSSFKKTLAAMQPGQTISAGRVAGSFTLPTDPSQKLGLIAGGIGITPFRSMVKYLTDTNQQRDIVLFYLVGDPLELAYREVFFAAQAVGVKAVPLTGGKPLTTEVLHAAAPDFAERTYYISGPSGLVNAYKKLLHAEGVPHDKVITDYFFGY